MNIKDYFNRSMHWIIVSGRAQLANGSDITIYRNNDSIYLPSKSSYYVSNLNVQPLIIFAIHLDQYIIQEDE